MVAPNSSPKQQRTPGDSSSTARSGLQPRRGASVARRSPKARLPTWSWVLQEVHERQRPVCRAGLAARRAAAMTGRLALPGEAFGQAAAQQRQRRPCEVGVVAVAFAGGDHVRRVVEVVVPPARRSRASRRLARVGPQPARFVGLVLQHQVHVPIGPIAARTRRASSARKCSSEASRIACTASSRRPSKRYSCSQYSALCTKKSRTTAPCGPRRRSPHPRACARLRRRTAARSGPASCRRAEVVVVHVEHHRQPRPWAASTSALSASGGP